LRAAKPPAIELTAVEPAVRAPVVAEIVALTAWAIVAFAALSLGALGLGFASNPGGRIGDALASWLSHLLGTAAIGVVLLAALLATELWANRRAADWRRLLRLMIAQTCGGMLMIAGAAAALGLLGFGRDHAGTFGVMLAGRLCASLNRGGGLIFDSLIVIAGLTLLAGHAPTEMLEALWARARAYDARRSRRASEPFPHVPLALDHPRETLPTQALEPAITLPLTPADKSPLTQSEKIPPPSRTLLAARNGTGGEYRLPPLELLDQPPVAHARVDEAAMQVGARLLEEKIAAFGVEGRVVEVQPGPVVSMYKLELGSGIKVSQIVNLADDLSMALRAATVRILAPVPGEAVVGIEVPNRKREKVFLREILEAPEFAAAHSHLTIALGKDIAGRPVAADLALMPHLLIAGATGTGKSVALHAMIASILFNATPDDVRLILIDPKMLELSVYDALPHLLVPVVVDPEKAAAALLWATREMEARYRLMRDLGVRNIDSYNRLLGSSGELIQLRGAETADALADSAGASDGFTRHQRMPKIVIVIDELADLLLSEGKTVERDITRLAQKARAAGIHLILATQRPSVDVITGLIKANLPARISLQVTSRVDSRTILDAIGAERLLGAGDMLFLPPGTAHLRRLHGPFVSENELVKVCRFIRAQRAPDYRMEILETAAVEGASEDGGDRDPLYDEAVRIVTDAGQASISMIQRRLRIGYNRAARMVEEMERDGLVLPADGARPRELRIRSN